MQSSAPSDAPSAIVSPSAPPPVVWDEQLGMSFTQDFTSLSYNVTAVEQADVDGYGPGYLLNGLSDSGYWYQVGFSWDWPNLVSGYESGFHLNYEVFNSRGNSIFPHSGGGGLDDFVGTVNGGDTILLSLYFSSGNVIMSGYDARAGQQIQIWAVPDSGWQFENWNGSGNGSYSGTVNQSSMTVDSAIVETATFYLGLTISVSGFGSVTYNYGSDAGSVPTGSSKVLHLPLNTNVSLTTIPSFYFFQFEKWSGAVNSTTQQVSITATAPITLQANFDFNWFNIITTTAVITAALAVRVRLLLSRKRNATQGVSSSALTEHEQDSVLLRYLSKCALSISYFGKFQIVSS